MFYTHDLHHIPTQSRPLYFLVRNTRPTLACPAAAAAALPSLRVTTAAAFRPAAAVAPTTLPAMPRLAGTPAAAAFVGLPRVTTVVPADAFDVLLPLLVLRSAGSATALGRAAARVVRAVAASLVVARAAAAAVAALVRVGAVWTAWAAGEVGGRGGRGFRGEPGRLVRVLVAELACFMGGRGRVRELWDLGDRTCDGWTFRDPVRVERVFAALMGAEMVAAAVFARFLGRFIAASVFSLSEAVDISVLGDVVRP